MPQYMHGHRFLCQRRTDVGGFPDVFGKPVLQSVPAESSSSLCGEQRGFWLTGPLGQPGPQDGDCARGERRDPLLSSLPVATHMRTGSEMDIGAAQAGQFRRPKTGLDSEAEQCGVAPPGPLRPIGRGEQGVDFLLGQEGHEPSLEAFWWNGKNALDGRKYFFRGDASYTGSVAKLFTLVARTRLAVKFLKNYFIRRVSPRPPVFPI